LFRYCQRIIDLDAEIPNRAFDLGMPEQKLDSPEIARTPVDAGVRALGRDDSIVRPVRMLMHKK
jgi:hypothetical protein